MCSIPKVFPNERFCWVMKLNKKLVFELLKLKNEEVTTYQLRKRVGVGIRRINQLWKEYQDTGKIPEIGKTMGRPLRHIAQEDKKAIIHTYRKYRFGAVILEPIIKRDFGKHIPHNTIHKVLLEAGLAKQLSKPCNRRKPTCRYERKHSLSLAHIDWHQRPMDGPWVFAVEDDASRALLALIECDSPTADTSITGIELALQHGSIQEILSDRGSQFTCNRDDPLSSRFEQYLEAKGIRHIRCRPKHPQTNGKVEKWFDTYERHRDAFETQEAFLEWYNCIRPHTGLDFSRLETPWQAFQRKMRC